MFFLLIILHFWRENDVTNFVPKFGFTNMGYLMLLFEKTFHKDLKTEKSFEICDPIKRHDILKCELLLFLVTKWRKIQISKLDIF